MQYLCSHCVQIIYKEEKQVIVSARVASYYEETKFRMLHLGIL